MWCSKLEHSEYNSTTEPNPLATALLVITITTTTTSITMPNLLPSYCLVYTTCLKWLSFSSVNANVCAIAKVLFRMRTIRQLVRQICVFIPTQFCVGSSSQITNAQAHGDSDEERGRESSTAVLPTKMERIES